MSRSRITWLVLALLVLAAAAWAWLRRAPEVPAVTLQRAPLVQTLQFSARVATRSRVDLGATITGRVQLVLVIEGAQVRQGDALVRLEDAELKSALAQALASEQQAEARLAGLRSSGRSAVQAGLAQADSVLVAARADLQRTRDLVARGFLSPARLDESERAVAVAHAQRDSARAQSAANAEQGTDVAQAQAQRDLARAASQAARDRLAQATLLAPADGHVLARAVEPGQIVQPGRALLTLALAGPLQVVAAVDERYLQQLQPGQAASVRADAFPNQPFAAQVLSISPLVDAQRGSVEVKFAVPQVPGYLREDMTLSVAVTTARRESTLVLPVAALRDGPATAGRAPAVATPSVSAPTRAPTSAATSAIPGATESATVWVAQDGQVQARPVRLGLRTLDQVEVLQGLAAGDRVLVGPAPAPGQRVRPAEVAANWAGAKAAGQDAGSAMTQAMGR